MSTVTPRHKLIGLMLISSGMLTYEISLTRLFAIQQFHHFAFVVVSLAVMGIAASGLILSLSAKQPALSTLALGFAGSTVVAYLTINFLPFDSYSITWDPRQIGVLLLYFLSTSAPFLFAGWAVGASLTSAGAEAQRPYAANLIGSALGCLVALGALPIVGGEGAVAVAITLGLLSGIAFSTSKAVRIQYLTLSILTLILAFFLPANLSLRLSPYKPLAVSQLLPDARVSLTLWSSSSRVDVIESESIHTFPGLSLNAAVSLPSQAAVFIDGDGPIPITELSPNSPSAQQLARFMPASLAYELRPSANTLVLQPGAGLDVLIALASGAQQITVAFDEPLIENVLEGPYADATMSLLEDPRVSVSRRSSRGALNEGERKYDVIQFSLSEAYRPVTSGAFSLAENYNLTVEAFKMSFNRLDQDGLLVITRWLGTPPSESVRVLSTLLEALSDLSDLTLQSIAYRGMRTATIIVSKQPFSDGELATTRNFLLTNGFDPIFLPDLEEAELNQHNTLPRDVYHEIFTALLEDPSNTISEYEFNLTPPTDDRPYFFHFFRWRQTPEVVATFGRIWQPFGGSGYLVLLVLLALMILLALPFIVVPILISRRNKSRPQPDRASLIYFGCLGTGYLLVEIPLIQNLTLLVDRAAISLAVVLFTLLLASGVGSLLSPRVPTRRALAALTLTLVLMVVLMPWAVKLALAWPLAGRLALIAIMLAPPGVLMGIPFAAGIRLLEKRRRGLIPWAWAVNGAVSGVSGVLAAMVSLDAGFSTTLVLGAMAYAGAWFTLPSLQSEHQSVSERVNGTNVTPPKLTDR